MGYNYRCSDRNNCGKRKTLKHPIDWYVRRPKCPECKRDTLKPVYAKEYERNKKRGCFCQGRWWPHNKGRIQDENHICIHADPKDVQATLDTWEMGGEVRKMHPDDDCPF